MSYDQIAQIVAQENRSGLSNELIICLIWKESSFDPLAQSRQTTARGLMQLTKSALATVQSNWTGFGGTTYKGLSDATTNVSVGTAYVGTRVDWARGNVQKGLNGYGTQVIRTISFSARNASRTKQATRLPNAQIQTPA